MKKFRLLTPGPTAVPEKVYAKFAEPIVHHRTSLFESQFKQLREQLQWLFQTRQPVLVLSASGTGSMDAAVSNLFSPNDEVVVVNGGKFAERWVKIAKAYQLKVTEIKVERGQAVTPQAVEEALIQNKNIKGVLFQASETSTGAMMPVKQIVDLCKKHSVLSVCDGISAVGIFDLPMDAWGIDALITGSQKAIMLPPGLAFLAFSERAWKAAEQSKISKFYFDLLNERAWQEKLQCAWTPPISLIQGAVVAMTMLQEQGLHEGFNLYARLGAATRAAVRAIGLEFFSPTQSPVLTTVKVPSTFSIDQGKAISKIMQDKYGVIIAGGQDELNGKILRLSHFGYVDIFDVVSGISALEFALVELGYPLEFGVGVGAALKTYYEGTPS